MSTVAGLVLAAGEGRRFGGPKAPVLVDGERLVDRAVRVLREGGCAPVYVVVGAWVGEIPGAVAVSNPQWPEGMGSSLRVGLEAVAAIGDVDRVVVTLVDLPGLTGDAVARLAASPARIAAAAYHGERGHPVMLGVEHFGGVADVARGDAGARDYLRAHADEVQLIEVGDVASGEDLDTPR
ncbi:MAG: nucleotidyltransferase family protein [Actinobacteria bacterium]|nr:nucleotidyltransferase family protein [Actinomycetota bacterium]